MTSPSVPPPSSRAAGHRRSTSLTATQQLPRMSALTSKPSLRSHASSGAARTATTSSSRFSQGPAATGGQVGLFADLPAVWSEPTASALTGSGSGGNIVLSDTAWPFGPPSQPRYVNPFKIGQMVVCPPAKKQKSAAQKLIDEVRKEKERERRRWERDREREKRKKAKKKAKKSKDKTKDDEEKSTKKVKHKSKKEAEEQHSHSQQDRQQRHAKRQASTSSMATTINTSSSPSSRVKLGTSILSLARSKGSSSSSKAWSIRSGTSRHMTSEEAQQRVADTATAAAAAADSGDAAEYCESTDPFPFRLSTSSGSDAPHAQHRRSHSPRMTTALAHAGSLVPALRRRDPARRQGGFFAPLQQQLEQNEPDHPHYSDMTSGGLGLSPASQPLTPMTALHHSLTTSTGSLARSAPQKAAPRVGFLTRKGSMIRSSSDSAKSTTSVSTTLSLVMGPNASLSTGGAPGGAPAGSLLKPRQDSILSGGPDRSRSSLGTISSTSPSSTRYSPTSPSKLSRSFSGEEDRSELQQRQQHSPTPGHSNVVVFDDEQRSRRARPPVAASSSWPTSLAALMNDSPGASAASSSGPGSQVEGTPSPLSLPMPLPSSSSSAASSSSGSSVSSSSHHSQRTSFDEDNDSSSTSSSSEGSQCDPDETEWTGKVVDIYRCGLGTPYWIVVEGLQTVRVPAAPTAPAAAAAADKAATTVTIPESSSGAATPRKWFKAAKAKAAAAAKGNTTPNPPATATTTTTTKVVRREYDARFLRNAEEDKEELDEENLSAQAKAGSESTKKAYHQDDPVTSGNDDSGIAMTIPAPLPPTLTSAAVQTDDLQHRPAKQVRQHQRGRHSPPLVILAPSKSLSAPPLGGEAQVGVASVSIGASVGGGGGSGQESVTLSQSLPGTQPAKQQLHSPQQPTAPPLPHTPPPARFVPFIRQRTSSLGCALDVARAGDVEEAQRRQQEVKTREREQEDVHEDDSIVGSAVGSDEAARG